MSLPDLKPCPLCGSDNAHVDEAWSGWFVECDGCQMQAGGVSTSKHAIDAWNTRPREEALEAEVAVLGAQVRSASEAAQVVWSGEHTRLEAALRPFLALARAVTVDGSPDFVHWAREAKDWTVAFSFAGHSISLGDLRALAALSHPKGADDGC